ncbi:MAG: gluconate 2-dehydrogenase subunit 3 family protein [Deltaproteobacteria bacterium]|nr:gluconate 2-dehydrogenase subunit 3 family protein [Deltaproteobacteria bacterium]
MSSKSIRPLRRDLGAVALVAAGLPLVRIRKLHAAEAPTAGARAGFFSPHQLLTVEHLAEQIIPQDEHSPGAREAEAAQTIDLYLLDLNPRNSDHVKRRALWKRGLVHIDKDANARFAKPFVKLKADDQYALLSTWADTPTTDPLRSAFFAELKARVAWAYYTSAVGIHQDMGYLGNTYSSDFEGEALGPPLGILFKQMKDEAP